MGADESRNKYDNMSLVNPKEIPVLIALDLGYSEQEIFCCYEADMNAATSVERLCDFDTTLTDVIVAFKKKRPEKKRPDKDETRSLLMIETKQLYVKTMCIACFSCEKSQLALPHFLVCENCRKETCIVCHMPVDEYKHIYAF